MRELFILTSCTVLACAIWLLAEHHIGDTQFMGLCIVAGYAGFYGALRKEGDS